jgi:membrane fusion protein (multidrug efflux system)
MKPIIIFIVPVVIFAACSSSATKKEEAQNKATPAPTYQVAVAEKAGVSTVIKLPAQLAAYEEVSIFPKANGYVNKVLVDIGSHVTKGQLLMTLDAPELLQASIQAREKYARSNADFTIDKERYIRLIEASQTAGAISPLDLSAAKSKMEADSAFSNAEKASWQMQETMLAYLQVTAPFTGVITERNVHPGALVSANAKDKAMLELKQVAHLRLQVAIPEALAGQVKNRDTVSFYVSALAGKKMTGTIVRRADNISELYHNEKIEVDVNNNDGQLSPGMYADVIFFLKGDPQALMVPKSAVVTSTERKYVLVMKDSTITKVDVTTGNQNTSAVEVYGALQPGDKVIINANDEITAGSITNTAHS